MLITLYGINNIGKTTHALRLVERLKSEGYDAVHIKYPVYEIEPTGVFLNQFLRSGEAQKISEEELQMWFALNRYQFEPTLKTHLAAGKIVVAEDYIGTGIAWGTVKGASTEWLETLNKHLIKEDVSLFLDGERHRSALEAGHLHEANDAFMTRSAEVHRELAARYSWTRVEVAESKDETAERLWNALALHLPQK